jgi:hypothetical protein
VINVWIINVELVTYLYDLKVEIEFFGFPAYHFHGSAMMLAKATFKIAIRALALSLRYNPVNKLSRRQVHVGALKRSTQPCYEKITGRSRIN